MWPGLPQAIHRRQASSYKYKMHFLCRSQPAGEGWRQTCITAGKHSPAGLSPTNTKSTCLCWSQPAGEGGRTTGITADEHSLAGQLLQGKSQTFVFVGASLLAKDGGQRASPQANIRWQTKSHRGQARLELARTWGLLWPVRGVGALSEPAAALRLPPIPWLVQVRRRPRQAAASGGQRPRAPPWRHRLRQSRFA